VTVKDPGSDGRTWLGRALSAVKTRLSDVLSGLPARPGCIPATTEQATTQSLPVDGANPTPTPEQINPGLAPGMDASPRNKS
jgi:hypothetical protein